MFRGSKLASLFDMDSLKDKFINLQDWIPLLRDETIFMENDGKLEHRQCGEVQLGQETLQSRETLDEGKDFVNCDI